MRRKWIQDRETGKLIEVDTRPRVRPAMAPAIIGDIEPFRSPLDGRLIGSRRDLRQHQEEHGVVQQREYGENDGREFFARKEQERHRRRTFQTEQDTHERKQALRQALDNIRS